MKNEVFLTVESLINLSGKLLRSTGDEPVCTEHWKTYQTDAVESGYCRTYIRSCPEGEEAAMVESLVAKIRAGEIPTLVMLTKEEVPAALVEELERAGFTVKKNQNGMIIDLADYEVAPLDLNVVRITEEELPAWSDLGIKAFGRAVSELPVLRKYYEDPTCMFYGYKVDGVLVATLLMSLQPGNAGIHEVCTDEAYRGRGICTALMNRAMADAKELGYPLMTLQASVFGEPVYAAMGMRTVCHMTTYGLAI